MEPYPEFQLLGRLPETGLEPVLSRNRYQGSENLKSIFCTWSENDWAVCFKFSAQWSSRPPLHLKTLGSHPLKLTTNCNLESEATNKNSALATSENTEKFFNVPIENREIIWTLIWSDITFFERVIWHLILCNQRHLIDCIPNRYLWINVNHVDKLLSLLASR